MKNWQRNKGQISKNGHLELVSCTFQKQPDFFQELGICQLPAGSGGPAGRRKPSENPPGAYVPPRRAVFSLPLTACAGLRINGKSNLKLPLWKCLPQLSLWSSGLQEICPSLSHWPVLDRGDRGDRGDRDSHPEHQPRGTAGGFPQEIGRTFWECFNCWNITDIPTLSHKFPWFPIILPVTLRCFLLSSLWKPLCNCIADTASAFQTIFPTI